MKVNKPCFVNTCVNIPIVTALLVKQFDLFIIIIFVGFLATAAWLSFENN